MKIVNKKKFIVKKFIARIIEILIIIATIILTIISIDYATKMRGYDAFGGEYLIPILGLLIVLVIETIYQESEEKKKYENRKTNKGRNKKA